MINGLSIKCFVVIGYLFVHLGSFSQAEQPANVFTPDDFFKIVRQHHPLAKRAEIQEVKGEGAVTSAKGNLDPEAFTDVEQKYYNTDKYYSLIDAGLKIPTYIGVDFYAGLEQNEGVFLNPENNTPTDGLWYAGISVPIGQGLLFDKRRADIKKAKLFLESTEVMQVQMLNDLFYEAGKAYWYWFEKYYDVLVYEDALEKASVRFEAVKQSALFGDRPSIDTLEAGIQVQTRQLSLKQAELDYMNARLGLETFLWADGIVPLEMDTSVVPVDLNDVKENLEISFPGVSTEEIINNHPDLRQQNIKIQSQEVEQKLKREMLKPKLDLKYNLLTANTPTAYENISINNYQWGVTFSMPIFLRQERGDLRMTKVKIQESELELESKRLSLENKAESWFNELTVTQSQVELFDQTVTDYQSLLNGEVRKFNLGESSLFMINSREVSYIQAQLKFINLISKNRKAVIGSRYALGNLINEL